MIVTRGIFAAAGLALGVVLTAPAMVDAATARTQVSAPKLVSTKTTQTRSVSLVRGKPRVVTRIVESRTTVSRTPRVVAAKSSAPRRLAAQRAPVQRATVQRAAVVPSSAQGPAPAKSEQLFRDINSLEFQTKTFFERQRN